MSPAERKRGDGEDVAGFIEDYARITMDTIAGKAGDPIRLRPWQHELLGGLFARRADGRRKHRQALIGLPRKNGKSALGSSIGLFGLLAEDDGAQVFSCAADRDQARIVFGAAKRMVELDAELSDLVKVYRDVLEVPSTGSIYRVLSSEAFTKEGLSPTLVIYDELHAAPNDELYNVMSLGSGARVDPILVAITTAGVRTDSLGADTVCYRLYQHGRRVASKEIVDPSFFFAWWEPKQGAEADHRDPKVWEESNPAYGDLIDPEDFTSTVARTPEQEFRTKRTNVFTVAAESALPHGAWDACRKTQPPPPDGSDIVLAFDGSWAGDSTGLIGVTPDSHIFTIAVWENPDDREWRVPIADVEAEILNACHRWTVREVACDPFRWQRSMQALESEGLPITEWPTNSVARIVPAWTRFYDAVMDKTLTHDGDPRLARHIENMVIKRDSRGPRPTKDSKMSGRHIDLGICAVIGIDRATQYAPDDAMAEPEVIWL